MSTELLPIWSVYPLLPLFSITRPHTHTQAVFDVIDEKLVLIEIAPGVTEEKLRECTEADFSVSDKLVEMRQANPK